MSALEDDYRRMVTRLREVYDVDESCLNATHTSVGEILAFDMVRRLKMGYILDVDLNVYTKRYRASYPDDPMHGDVPWSHLNSFIHSNMSLLSRHAKTRARYTYARACGNPWGLHRQFDHPQHSYRGILHWDRLCRKLMEQMSYVFGVKMYIRDHSNRLNPSTYIRVDLEDKTISDSDELPGLEVLDNGRHKDLLIRSTVLQDKYLYEYEHDVAVVW
tara:strand:+ start:646 stop:1296 length:651 start_codon:yes stop_codon:yes gene_type:complete